METSGYLIAMLALAACARAPAELAVTGTSGGSAQPDDTSTSAADTGTTSGGGDESSSSSTAVADDPPVIFDVQVSSDQGRGRDPSECACAAGTEAIYVLSDNGQLWSFDPFALQFEFVGSFACGGFSSTFSMGVDRNAIAWVMLADTADIYTIDVNDPNTCTDPGYLPGQLGFAQYGMAFVSAGEHDPCDRLYALRYSGSPGFSEGPGIGALGTVDPELLELTEIGPTDYDGGELTGTGDGRLFAFAGTSPAKLLEFDKTDASVMSVLPLDALELTNAFAFAFYAGDFYLFTEGEAIGKSQVTRLDYDGDQELEVVVAQAPIRVVGAGVSTCAPVVPPG